MSSYDYAVIAAVVVSLLIWWIYKQQRISTQTHFDAIIYDLMNMAYMDLPGSTDTEKIAYVVSRARQLWIVKTFLFTDMQISDAARVALVAIRKQHEAK